MAYGALGGGTFTVQNKLLPGTYVKMVVNQGRTDVWQGRGYAAIGLPLDWGAEGEIITLKAKTIQDNSLKLLGHDYLDTELKPIRDIFKGAEVLHLYNLNTGGKKAKATIAGVTVEAKQAGEAGNNIAVTIEKYVNDPEAVVITTKFKGIDQDEQIIKTIADFEDNSFIVLSGTEDKNIASGITEEDETIGNLVGGTNGTVDGKAHSDFLSKIPGKYFNVIAYAGQDEDIKNMYIEFSKRMIDEVGLMHQLLVFNAKSDNRFISSVGYKALSWEETSVAEEASSVFWQLGQAAGIELGESISAKVYDGEYEIEVITNPQDGIEAIEQGQLVMAESDGEIRLLADVNTATESVKGQPDWGMNENVRIILQRVQNVSMLFNKYYMHKELNNQIGRDALWSDLTWSAEEQFQNQLRVIQNYSPEDTVVTAGEQKDGVVIQESLQTVNTMSKLYFTVNLA